MVFSRTAKPRRCADGDDDADPYPIREAAKPRRCADVADDTPPYLASSSPASPRHAVSRRSPLRVGAAAAAALVAIGGIAISSLNNPVVTASSATEASSVPFDRGSQFSRTSERYEPDESQIDDDLRARDAALADTEKSILTSHAANTLTSREKFLSTTRSGIASEAARLKREENKLQFPAEGRPGSPWGMRMHPILGYARMHWGMDIGAACGSPLRSVYDGTVINASFNSGAGNHVNIQHDTFRGKSLRADYFHMTRYIVHTGQRVKKGEVIGYTGSTGLSTECHLHFQTIWGGVNVNPATLLDTN